jgi:hypothetical protein
MFVTINPSLQIHAVIRRGEMKIVSSADRNHNYLISLLLLRIHDTVKWSTEVRGQISLLFLLQFTTIFFS